MVDPASMRRFLFRCLYLGLSALIIFLYLLPLTTEPRMIPGPDLLFCLTAVWLMRRPRWAPVLLIVLVHLVADILFLRPMGLWPALSLLAYEYLRRKSTEPTEIPLIGELGMIAVVFTLLVGGNGLVHIVFGLPHPGFGATLLHIVVTMLAYPLVMAFSIFVARVRRARPSDLDGSGVTA